MLCSRDRAKFYVIFCFVSEDNTTIRPADVSVIERHNVGRSKTVDKFQVLCVFYLMTLLMDHMTWSRMIGGLANTELEGM
jgi:hypothetical protein